MKETILTLEKADYWTPEQVAEFAEVAVTTLAKWRRTGKGPAYIGIARHPKYHRSDVLTWYANQRKNATNVNRESPRNLGVQVQGGKERISRFDGPTRYKTKQARG